MLESIIMSTPQINAVPISGRSMARELSSTQIKDVQTGQNQFAQVMDLVAPKDIAPPPREQEMASNEVDDQVRAEGHDEQVKQVERTQPRDQQERVQETQDKTHAQQPENAQPVQGLDEQQQAKLKLLAQMSREDLMQLIQWQQNLDQNPLGLQENVATEELSRFPDLSTGDLMALLNGFQHAQQPEFQGQMQADFPQLQWLESQLLQTQQQNTQGLAQQFANLTQSQMQLNTAQQAQMVPVVDAMMRPQEAMPMLNVLRLTQAQKEGVVRQVAQGFKTQSNGTQSAEIRLHPEELGMVKLKVEMRGADVRVFFSAENQIVGDLLTQNIDQLKALLSDQEFNLIEAGLFQDQLPDQQQNQASDEGEDYGSDDRPDLKHRPKKGPRMSPLPGRFRATV